MRLPPTRWNRDDLAGRIARIEADLKALVRDQVGVEAVIWSHGAYWIHPRHLVFGIGVATDALRDRLRADAVVQRDWRALLARHGWPAVARDAVAFFVESQQTVDRDSGGNWWHHVR